jgi:hypothetical protein
MAVKTIKLNVLECTCERCGNVWVTKPTLEKGKWVCIMPVACAQCKSAYWNRPRKEAK